MNTLRPLHLALTLLALALALPTATSAQSTDAKTAERLYLDSGRTYNRALADQQANRPADARTAFTTAIDRLREAQSLIRRDLHRYRYAEAQSLRALGQIDDAMRLLRELAAQTDSAEISTLAKTTLAEIETSLAPLALAQLQLDCGAQDTTVRLTLQATPQPTPAPTPALAHWQPCTRFQDPQPIPAGRYTVHLRRTAANDPGETTRSINLAPGERRTMLVHYEMAPPPDVHIEVSGCGASGKQVKPAQPSHQAKSTRPTRR